MWSRMPLREALHTKIAERKVWITFMRSEFDVAFFSSVLYL